MREAVEGCSIEWHSSSVGSKIPSLRCCEASVRTGLICFDKSWDALPGEALWCLVSTKCKHHILKRNAQKRKLPRSSSCTKFGRGPDFSVIRIGVNHMLARVPMVIRTKLETGAGCACTSRPACSKSACICAALLKRERGSSHASQVGKVKSARRKEPPGRTTRATSRTPANSRALSARASPPTAAIQHTRRFEAAFGLT
jgi:hypothetical protein